MIKIKIVGDSNGWEGSNTLFDPNIQTEDADGLLCWGLPNSEYYKYKGIKAWYYSEPLYFSMRRYFQMRLSQLRSPQGDFLHFSRKDRKFNIPMVTHYSPLTIEDTPWEERRNDCIAIVSNHGGKWWWLSRAHMLRNQFATNPRVTLFGSRKAWQLFKETPFSKPCAPLNYSNEWPSECQWYDPQHVELLAKYRYVIALENSCEYNYLSEKLINAFRAGAMPIYHAHPSVRNLLNGAKWFDPSDYGFSVDATLEAAMNAGHRDIQLQNYAWLNSYNCSRGNCCRVWERISDYFVRRLSADGIKLSLLSPNIELGLVRSSSLSHPTN